MSHSLIETDRQASAQVPPERSDQLTEMLEKLASGVRLTVVEHPSRGSRASFLDQLVARLEPGPFRILRTASKPGVPFDLRCLMQQILPQDETEDADPAKRFYATLTQREGHEDHIVLIIDDAEQLTDKTFGYLDLMASTASFSPVPLQFVLAGNGVLLEVLPDSGHFARDKVAMRVAVPSFPATAAGPAAPAKPPSPAKPAVETQTAIVPAPTGEPARRYWMEPGLASSPALPPDELPAIEPRQSRKGAVAMTVIVAVVMLGGGILFWKAEREEGAWQGTLRGQAPAAGPTHPSAAPPPAPIVPVPNAAKRVVSPPSEPPAPKEKPAVKTEADATPTAMPPPPPTPPLVAAPPVVAPPPPVAAPPVVAAPPAVVAPPAPAATGSPAMSPAVLATLLARGQTLLTNGDVAAARQMFERAAAANSAPGAVALGMTYDPSFLAQINAQGIAPDAARAAYWYQRATELGSMDAPALQKQLERPGGG